MIFPFQGYWRVSSGRMSKSQHELLESYSTEFAKRFQIKFYFTCYHSDSEWQFEFWRSFDY